MSLAYDAGMSNEMMHIRHEGIMKMAHLNTYAHRIVSLIQEHRAEKSVQGAYSVAFEGDLGAGKTTLIQHIGAYMGIAEPMQSPTFVVMKRYGIPQHIHGHSTPYTQLIHIDAYRIESEQEARVLDLESCMLDPHTLIFLEWPERIPGLIPHMRIQLAHAENQETEDRRITISVT